jgi:hypothetical protein
MRFNQQRLFITILAFTCLILTTLAISAVKKDTKPDDPRLHGNWISTNINSDSILFDFVDSIEIEILKGHRFKGIGTIVGGETISKTGSYRVVKNKFFAKVDGISGEETATYVFKGKMLIIKDKALSLTVTFKRKTKGSSDSSSWF